MSENTLTSLENHFENLKSLSNEQIGELIGKYLDDEAIEVFVDHIEDFYGIEDDEQLGMLAQIMISGFVAAKEIK